MFYENSSEGESDQEEEVQARAFSQRSTEVIHPRVHVSWLVVGEGFLTSLGDSDNRGTEQPEVGNHPGF